MCVFHGYFLWSQMIHDSQCCFRQKSRICFFPTLSTSNKHTHVALLCCSVPILVHRNKSCVYFSSFLVETDRNEVKISEMYPRFRTSPDSLLVIVGINIIIPEQWATLPHEFIHINKQFMLYDRLRSFNSVTSGNAAAHLCLKCGGIRALFPGLGAATRSSGVTPRLLAGGDLRIHVANIKHQQPPAYQSSLLLNLRGESPHWKQFTTSIHLQFT